MLFRSERLGDAADRSARFVCAAVYVDGDTEIERVATWEGTIAAADRGAGGFGYDPLFVPDGETLTFAELPWERKNAISHRARAVAALREAMRAG